MAAVNSLSYEQTSAHPAIALGIGVFVGSIGIVFIRNAQLEQVPTIAIAVIRFTLTVLIFTPFILRQYGDQLRQLNRRDIAFSALAGVMFAIGLISNFESFNHTSILIAWVMTASAPLWAALIERVVLKTPLHRNIWLGLFLTLIGSVVIASSIVGESAVNVGSSPLLGAGLALFGAIVNAVYFIAGRSVRPRISLVPYVWLVCIFAALTSLLIAFFTHTPLTGHSASGYFWILLITLGPQITVQSSINYALAYLPATVVSMATRLTSIGNAIAALIFFQQVPLPVQVTGSAVILAGVALAHVRHNKG